MKAVTVADRMLECHDFEEGAHGVVLRDRDGKGVGYVPYENLARVERFRSPVSSSSVRSIGYHEDARALEVEFHSGGVYRYREVPREVFEQFHAADSRGRFLHDRVRDQYEYQRIA